MADKKIMVTKSSMPSFDEYIAEIAPLWDSHWLTNAGEKHCEFEKMLEKRLSVENVSLFTNGHSALEFALEALGLGSDGRRKVITTPFTFASTTHEIVRRGLEPVFADISPDDYTINPECVERLVDADTCAILPVHVYGNLCDVNAIQDIANRHGLKVIYDAAHAFGVERNGVSSATFGDASMFSFHATKVFNTIEGGAVCCKDAALKPVLNQLRNFGIVGTEDVERIGGNAKMNEFCAAMGICNLRHLDEEIAKREHVAERYWDQLRDVPGIQLCEPPRGVKYNYSYMPVVFGEEFGAARDEVFDALAEQGISASKYFYPLISDYKCYANKFDSTQTPVAKDIASRILTLPMFADLAIDDVDRICKIVRGCKR